MSDTRRWLVLCVVLMGTFMAILDVAIVNVAIPSIRSDLGASFGEIEFVVSAYTLTYACLLVTGGRLGDSYGRKLLFIVGLVVFAAASAGCGLAPTSGFLIGARAVQGIGGALMYPQVLAIIQVNFTGDERAKALGVFGSVIGIAAVAGQILGGTILALDIWHLAWRPIFLVNVPLAVGTIIAAVFILPKDERSEAVGLDGIGVVLVTAALFLLIVPLLEGRELGWPVWMIAAMPIAFCVFALFVWYERRFAQRGGRPLVRIDLFACKSFAFGVPIAALFMASYAGLLFTLALYLQVGLHFSALQSGMTYTPMAIGFFITSLASPRLIPLLGRQVLTLGYLVGAFGLAATATTVYAAGARLEGYELVPSLFIAGLGNGLGLSPLVGTVIAGLAPQEAGAGAGIVTTTLQVGNALGVALIGLLFFTLLGSAGEGVAYAHVFAMTLPTCAVLLLAAAFLVRRLPRTPFEVSNALIERLPGWSAGFAYSMFLMTGGRLGDGLVQDLVAHVVERRLRRTRHAPQAVGEFLAFHFHEGESDVAWLHYLMREALVFGNRPVPQERERAESIAAQIKEIRDRQALGLLPADLDPAALRLMAFALVSYPRMLPQITRTTTGLAPDDPRFGQLWEALLREVGTWIEAAAHRNQLSNDSTAPVIEPKSV
ncbi:MAG TPA: MFS transporter [Beijerinckiaceae bacterium]|nr:MFS transporter [Beijerinckiaceae bacterium]